MKGLSKIGYHRFVLHPVPLFTAIILSYNQQPIMLVTDTICVLIHYVFICIILP